MDFHGISYEEMIAGSNICVGIFSYKSVIDGRFYNGIIFSPDYKEFFIKPIFENCYENILNKMLYEEYQTHGNGD